MHTAGHRLHGQLCRIHRYRSTKYSGDIPHILCGSSEDPRKTLFDNTNKNRGYDPVQEIYVSLLEARGGEGCST